MKIKNLKYIFHLKRNLKGKINALHKNYNNVKKRLIGEATLARKLHSLWQPIISYYLQTVKFILNISIYIAFLEEKWHISWKLIFSFIPVIDLYRCTLLFKTFISVVMQKIVLLFYISNHDHKRWRDYMEI